MCVCARAAQLTTVSVANSGGASVIIPGDIDILAVLSLVIVTTISTVAVAAAAPRRPRRHEPVPLLQLQVKNETQTFELRHSHAVGHAHFHAHTAAQMPILKALMQSEHLAHKILYLDVVIIERGGWGGTDGRTDGGTEGRREGGAWDLVPISFYIQVCLTTGIFTSRRSRATLYGDPA